MKIGVLTPVQKSQQGNPLSRIPKKEETARFIKGYHRINRQMVRNPYVPPKIGKNIKKLKCFQNVSLKSGNNYDCNQTWEITVKPSPDGNVLFGIYITG